MTTDSGLRRRADITAFAARAQLAIGSRNRIMEVKMRKSLVTMLCSALIAVSSVTVAAAAERHAGYYHARKTAPRAAVVNEQFRNSYNAQFRDRDSYVSGPCGLFPGPCQ
jgi:hypothetical protein